jgi:hypothetical protein
MKNLNRRLEALEHEHGVSDAMPSQEDDELLRKCLLSHYGGSEVDFTPLEREMLEEVLQ